MSLFQIAYVSSDGSSNAINKTDGFESSNSMVLDGLTINTQYNISVRAYTSAGPGVSDSALGMTNEDGRWERELSVVYLRPLAFDSAVCGFE